MSVIVHTQRKAWRQLLIVGLAISWGTLLRLSAQEPLANPDADVPVAPISPFAFEGWTNAIRLVNTNLEVIIVPSLGRIMSLRYRGGDNLLRLANHLGGYVPDRKNTEWVNIGGEWLWPMAQSAWPQIAGADWPPPEVLADAPWTASAWKAADGRMNCMLNRQYGRPLYIKVSRTFRLDPEKAELTIRQRIERTRQVDTPLTLWNIFQIAGATMVVMPVDEASAFDGGFRSMMFEFPPSNSWQRCEGVIVYAAERGEHKLCSDSQRTWIAALKKDIWLVVSARHDSSSRTYPDGGCTLEMYSNAGLGYTEIEVLSPEIALDDGAVLQNEVTVRCIPLTESETCRAAKELRDAIGDTSLPLPEITARRSVEAIEEVTAAP